MQTIEPAKAHLFCKPDEAITKSKSGILLGEATASRPNMATVINSNSELYKRDDKVLYKSYTANETKVNGDEYIILNELDVLGTVVEVSE